VFSHLAIRSKSSIDISFNFLPHVNLPTVLAQLRQLKVPDFRQTLPKELQSINCPHLIVTICARYWLLHPYPMSQCLTSCRVISHVSLIIFRHIHCSWTCLQAVRGKMLALTARSESHTFGRSLQRKIQVLSKTSVAVILHWLRLAVCCVTSKARIKPVNSSCQNEPNRKFCLA
jgi:hypothetical protein